MQLVGSVFGAMTTAVGVAGIIAASDAGPYERADSSELLWLLLLTGTGVVRSVIHRSAGAELIYGQNPFGGIKKYFVASLVNAGAWLAFLGGESHMPGSVLVPILLVLVSWPIALLVITGMPGFREMSEQVPASEDKGFEGASILMLTFGLLGFIGTSLVLYAMWTGSPSEAHSDGKFMMVVIALVVLVIRSGIHIGAASTGLRETRLDQVVGAVNRYCDFGVIAAFIAGGAMLLSVMMLQASAAAFVVIACVVWALLAWPLTLRRFFGERQFADLMAGAEGGAPHHRAPDLGLTTLGWLLFAQAIVGLSLQLPMALMLPSGAGLGQFESVSALFGGSLGQSPWWTIGVLALQLWAAIELIRMGELHRIAATAYGVITTGVTVYLSWPILSHLGVISREAGMSMALVTTFGALALELTIPLVTLFAANRGVLPSASARYRA